MAGLWLSGAAAFALLAVAVSVFAIGECLQGAVQPTLVVDLADPRLIGRYMAVSALSWQVGFTIRARARWCAARRHSPTGLWVVMATVCVVGGLAALAVERGLPESQRRTPRAAVAEEPVRSRSWPPEPEATRAAG